MFLHWEPRWFGHLRKRTQLVLRARPHLTKVFFGEKIVFSRLSTQSVHNIHLEIKLSCFVILVLWASQCLFTEADGKIHRQPSFMSTHWVVCFKYCLFSHTEQKKTQEDPRVSGSSENLDASFSLHSCPFAHVLYGLSFGATHPTRDRLVCLLQLWNLPSGFGWGRLMIAGWSTLKNGIFSVLWWALVLASRLCQEDPPRAFNGKTPVGRLPDGAGNHSNLQVSEWEIQSESHTERVPLKEAPHLIWGVPGRIHDWMEEKPSGVWSKLWIIFAPNDIKLFEWRRRWGGGQGVSQLGLGPNDFGLSTALGLFLLGSPWAPAPSPWAHGLPPL